MNNYFTRDGWLDLQLLFWEARMDIEKRGQKPRGFEYCRTSSACWVRRTPYDDDIKRGYYREDSEPDS